KEFYTFTIQQTRLDLVKETLGVDSVNVIADLGKLEFGRKRGYEVDRFEGSIPFLKVKNFTLSFPDAKVKAGVAEAQFYLKIFRDKRLPFKKSMKPLPIDAIRALPFELEIDSLKIIKSYVQYEEFGEEAPDPGGLYFDDLYAVLSNISSTATNGNMQLIADAELMGQGDLSMAVTFPLVRNKRSTLVGSLQDFEMSRINPMIKPAANIEVESGKMKKLSFNFTFNSVRSDGEIELNYEDLKLISYKDEDKDNDDELDKDNLKSFMMNTFVFRKNMDEGVPEEKRTGTVMFLRDENRSVLNFWVKSLLSGIKSAYKLDKAVEKEEQRELKKEERLSRRLERKLKKSEKKKDRG
ncbi:MAG TPA: DUF748 domain-containing protein, partial [Chryseosolibacter sp.]|nr:DUF748 domain-containing protein [Chryseosolibacter sp.]